MGLFDKVRQVLARAEKVLPGTDRGPAHRVPADDRLSEDRSDQPGPLEGGDADAADLATPADPEDHPAVAPEKDEAEPQTQPRRYRTHTLLPGQSLVEVAGQHGVGVQELAELNGVDPELVFAGQVLRIPHR